MANWTVVVLPGAVVVPHPCALGSSIPPVAVIILHSASTIDAVVHSRIRRSTPSLLICEVGIELRTGVDAGLWIDGRIAGGSDSIKRTIGRGVWIIQRPRRDALSVANPVGIVDSIVIRRRAGLTIRVDIWVHDARTHAGLRWLPHFR